MGRRTLLMSGLILIALSGPSWAQRKLPFSPKATAKANAAQDAIDREHERKQRLNQAKRNFTRAELEAIAAASSEIAAAKAAHQAAIRDFKSTRDAVEKSVEASLGLQKAQEEVAAAQKAYRDVADPVLQALKGTPEYQKVEKAAAAANVKIRELKEDTSLTDEEKKTRLQALVNESMGPSNLERAALQKEPRVKAAREQLETLQQKLAELQKKAAEKVEKDSTVTAAQEAVRTAYASLQAAEVKLATVEAKGAIGEQLLEAGVIPRKGAKGNTQGKGAKKN